MTKPLATVLDFLDDRVHLCGRVWLLLNPDKHKAEDVYGYLGDERIAWTVPGPMSLMELLSWAATEGLLVAEQSPLLSAAGNAALTKQVESGAELTAARVLSAGGSLRGNLVPSSAQAAVRSILSGEPGVKFVAEPDDDLEAHLAANAVHDTQIVVVLSWRQPMNRRRWAVIKPGMDALEQLLQYQGTNSAWAEQVEAACLTEG